MTDANDGKLATGAVEIAEQIQMLQVYAYGLNALTQESTPGFGK